MNAPPLVKQKIFLWTILVMVQLTNIFLGGAQSRQIEPKIVGGVKVPRGTTIPYQLSLRVRGHHTCGAVIINQTEALTAAHCVKSAKRSDLTVVAGGHDLLHMEEYEKIHKVRSIILHPGYNEGTQANDIAILIIDSPGFAFNRYVDKINIPGPLIPDFAGFTGIASGWGRTSQNGPISNVLQTVELSIISREACRKLYGYSTIRETMMCAQAPGSQRRDTCQGDSGGPLIIHSKYRGVTGPVLVGITSWGRGCGDRNFPGVYTQVNKFAGWIRGENRGVNILNFNLDNMASGLGNKVSEKIGERSSKWMRRIEKYGGKILDFFKG